MARQQHVEDRIAIEDGHSFTLLREIIDGLAGAYDEQVIRLSDLGLGTLPSPRRLTPDTRTVAARTVNNIDPDHWLGCSPNPRFRLGGR